MPAARRPRSVLFAARQNDELGMLIALRDKIAARIHEEELRPRDLASLTRQLRELNRDIREMRPPKNDGVDDAAEQEPKPRGGSPF